MKIIVTVMNGKKNQKPFNLQIAIDNNDFGEIEHQKAFPIIMKISRASNDL